MIDDVTAVSLRKRNPRLKCVRVALGLLLGAVTLSPSSADASGRFPAAGYFVAGPGPRSDVFALRTTFGVVVSRDAGRAWSWVCESAYGAVGSVDKKPDAVRPSSTVELQSSTR